MTISNEEKMKSFASRLTAKGRLLDAGFTLDVAMHLSPEVRNSNIVVDLRAAYFAGATRVFMNMIDDPLPDGLADRVIDALRREMADYDRSTHSLIDHYAKHGKKGPKLPA